MEVHRQTGAQLQWQVVHEPQIPMAYLRRAYYFAGAGKIVGSRKGAVTLSALTSTAPFDCKKKSGRCRNTPQSKNSHRVFLSVFILHMGGGQSSSELGVNSNFL